MLKVIFRIFSQVVAREPSTAADRSLLFSYTQKESGQKALNLGDD